jgi:hypothetical protein
VRSYTKDLLIQRQQPFALHNALVILLHELNNDRQQLLRNQLQVIARVESQGLRHI